MPVIEVKTYVEYRDNGYWIAGTRISLDSVVYTFRNGLSPESIVQSFPLLTLEQVYGAIAFYLANREQIDTYLALEEEEFNAMAQPLQTTDPSLYNKLISRLAKKQRLGVCHFFLKHMRYAHAARTAVSGQP
ncbi:DUF433 domain-containing protein [Moorena sp. SIO4A5]|uniref:DUF433 domain-containing protein n=1 Tax=Moorena sp. SIO4A5 TaxID=2607838 RepID=UPI0025F18527|nr:DUF433 domain-containing protein [Moorena sp. SIO4A5]